MARDHRLDFVQGQYLAYGKDLFQKRKNLDFNDLFSVKASSGAAPWTPNRFDSNDLRKRISTRKLQLNPGLQQVTGQEERIEVFSGLGSFDRDKYDFLNGRPLTNQRPEIQPGFNKMWMEFYNLSPTVKPPDRISNPMPRAKNPDPKGYIMARMESKVKNEMEGNKSVAQLVSNEKEDDKEDTKA
jgi:hypothetical protein